VISIAVLDSRGFLALTILSFSIASAKVNASKTMTMKRDSLMKNLLLFFVVIAAFLQGCDSSDSVRESQFIGTWLLEEAICDTIDLRMLCLSASLKLRGDHKVIIPCANREEFSVDELTGRWKMEETEEFFY
jgi:hypothetical protein